MPQHSTKLRRAQRELIDYYLSGNHTFVACDDKKRIKSLLNELNYRLLGEESITLDCAGFTSTDEFAHALTRQTNALLKKFGEISRLGTQDPGTCLQVMNELLARSRSQGFLLIVNVDDAVSAQATFEIEASLREVMQFRSDLAVLIIGSRSIIIAMGQSDRPFYLSFRKFWLDDFPK